MTSSEAAKRWIDEVSALCKPDEVWWCDGSEKETEELLERAQKSGDLMKLNQEKLPNCYLHRSNPNDVARVEKLTFICSKNKDDAGPTNNWMDPEEAKAKLTKLYDGCMKGRTMYVLPFIMGPAGSPFSKVGIEVTDSLYVVHNMRMMTRMGQVAWDHLGSSDDFTKGFHAVGDCNPERRYICHFPETNEIWSFGSGYGGNALLGKKCLALRLASYLGRTQGWMAEHMLILGLENPQGEIRYITAAFPSACGKTNLAMLLPPEQFKGWKAWTVGDDIAWLRPGDDGRLWAVNPEAGFFGVVPGTSSKTNPMAMQSIAKDTIYTNVGYRSDGTVWWEGHDEPPPAEGLIDWKGNPWTPSSGEKAAHPNSRFTALAANCPTISPEWENPKGVPISAMLFGARRGSVVPLVYEAVSWQHGTFLGATLSSEKTAAAEGKVGDLRRDPMAMLPFCGYNMADYWGHWLEMGKQLKNPPKIFRVNWFRSDKDGKFLWPGFGENIRVLKWVLDRCEGKGEAVETAIGYVPTRDAINRTGLNLSDEVMDELLRVEKSEWVSAIDRQTEFFAQFGDRLPEGIAQEHKDLARRVGAA